MNPDPEILDDAARALDFCSAALRGDLQTLQRLAPQCGATDRADALCRACEGKNGAAALWLADADLTKMPVNTLNTALAFSARHGLLAVTQKMMEKHRALDLTQALVSALLAKQTPSIAWMASHTSLDAVVDDFEEHYDEAYRLSRSEMAEVLDQLAPFSSPGLRTRLLNGDLHRDWLPYTVEVERAMGREGRAGEIKSSHSVRNRPRA